MTPTEIAILNLVIGSLTFVLGLWGGHRLTLRRERRKEFNEAVTAVRARLLSLKERPTPYTSGVPSVAEMDLIEPDLGFIRRMRLHAAIHKYKQCHKKQQHRDEAGQVFYQNPEIVGQSVGEILRHLKRR